MLHRGKLLQDVAQPVPPSPGMHQQSSIFTLLLLRLSQEPVGEDTLRATYAAPRDPVEQGAHILPEEATAKPVELVTIFPKNMSVKCYSIEISGKLCTSLQ